MIEHVPARPPELDLTIPEQPSQPDQDVIVIDQFTLIKEAIVQECSREYINLHTMPVTAKPAVSKIIGQTLSDHTTDLNESYSKKHSGQRPPFTKVPGTISQALRRVYTVTQANTTLYTTSPMLRGNAEKYRSLLIDIAHKNTERCPEIRLADQLARRWGNEGLAHASDSATNLLASYGLRIKGLLDARIQRRSDVRPNHPWLAENNRWRRELGE